MENHSARRRQRFLPQAGLARQRNLHCKNITLLRKMLPAGYLQEENMSPEIFYGIGMLKGPLGAASLAKTLWVL